jgi:hypothetical protein
MTRLPLLIVLSMVLAACNVERDAANDTTAISLNDQKVEGTVDQAGNLLEGAASEVREAANDAAPAIQGAAREAGDAAQQAGRTIEAGAEGATQGVREETRDNPNNGNRQ